MTDLEVRIVRLEAMRVASVRTISESPEHEAWEKMRAWAEPRELLDDVEKHPVFGFNSPNPSPESKEYGYEFWIRIGPEIEAEGEIEAKEFAGGLYAVTTCKGIPNPDVWKRLWEWVQSSKYKWRRTHELEKAHNSRAPEEDLVFDLYLPIKE